MHFEYKNMPSQKSETTILRQWMLLKSLLSRYQTTQQIHQKMLEQDITISERTLLRDLKQLEAVGFPIKSSDSKPINWCLQKEWQEKIGGMTDAEALLVLLVKEYLQDTLPTTMTKQLDDLFVMAQKRLNDNSINQAQWLNKIRVIAAQQPQLAPFVKVEIKHIICQALIDNQVIRATYKSHEFLLSPLALVIRGQILYLAAIDGSNVQQVKHFALHRFDEADIAYGEIFYTPENFDIDTLLKEGWGHFRHEQDENLIRLECWCDVDLKNHLTEMRLANNQWIDFANPVNGRYLLNVNLPYTWQLKQWLLSQGSKIEVIKPLWLRQELAGEIATMLKNYQ